MVLARPALIGALTACAACAPASIEVVYPLAPGEAATQLVAVEAPGAALALTVAAYGTPVRIDLPAEGRVVVELLTYAESPEALGLVVGPVRLSDAADARLVPPPRESWRTELDGARGEASWTRTIALGDALAAARLEPAPECGGLGETVQTRIIGADAALALWAIDADTAGLLTQNLRLWRVRRGDWSERPRLIATSTAPLSARAASRARDGTFVFTSTGTLWRTSRAESASLVALARSATLPSAAAIAIDDADPSAETWLVGTNGAFSRVSRGAIEAVHTFSGSADISYASVVRAGPGHAAAAVDRSPEVAEVRAGALSLSEPFGPNEGVTMLARWERGWVAGSAASRLAVRGDDERAWRVVGEIPDAVTLGAVYPLDPRRLIYGGDYGFVGVFSLDRPCPIPARPIHDRRVSTFVRVGDYVALSGRGLPGRTNVVTWIRTP